MKKNNLKKNNFFKLSISSLRLDFKSLKGVECSLKDVLINYFFIIGFTSFFCVMTFSKLSDIYFWRDVILYTTLFFSLYILIGYLTFVGFFKIKKASFWAGVNISLPQVMGFSFLNSVIGSDFILNVKTIIFSLLFLYFAIVQSITFSVIFGIAYKKALFAYGSVLFFASSIIVVFRYYFVLSL